MTLVLVCTNATVSSIGGGPTYDMSSVGLVMFGAVIVTVHLQLIIVEEQFTWLHHLAIWGSQGEPTVCPCRAVPCRPLRSCACARAPVGLVDLQSP